MSLKSSVSFYKEGIRKKKTGSDKSDKVRTTKLETLWFGFPGVIPNLVGHGKVFSCSQPAYYPGYRFSKALVSILQSNNVLVKSFTPSIRHYSNVICEVIRRGVQELNSQWHSTTHCWIIFHQIFSYFLTDQTESIPSMPF